MEYTDNLNYYANVWEISEDGTHSLRYKISATIRSRVSRAENVKVLDTLNTSSVKCLSVRRCLTSEWCRLKEEEEASSNLLCNKLGIMQTP